MILKHLRFSEPMDGNDVDDANDDEESEIENS